MCFVTVAHHVANGSDGAPPQEYTRSWLGVLS